MGNASIEEKRRQEKITRFFRVTGIGLLGGVIIAFLYILPTTGVIPSDSFIRLGLPFIIMILIGILNKSIPEALASCMLAYLSYTSILFFFLVLPVLLGIYTGNIVLFALANMAIVIQTSLFLFILTLFGGIIGVILYEFI